LLPLFSGRGFQRSSSRSSPVAGIVVGPSVLGWVKIDQPVGLVALLGLAFLLFLAGLEVDLKVITPGRLRVPLAGYTASLLLGSAAGFVFHAAGWVSSPLFLAITLSSSSLGLAVPVLADALQSRTLLGQLTIEGATLGQFGAITLLSWAGLVQSARPGRMRRGAGWARLRPWW
jgi:Kef-type K+ transport system membrane component KefB